MNVGSYEDFLGELYMDLGASNERNGQFFTPMSISRVMAKLAGIDTVEKLENKRFVSLLEPLLWQWCESACFRRTYRR